jgi:hypothetical protein
VPSAPTALDRKLSEFLKKRRGEMSYAQFSKITGFTPSSLFRLENCEQSMKLSRLDDLLKRLKVTMWEVFGR